MSLATINHQKVFSFIDLALDAQVDRDHLDFITDKLDEKIADVFSQYAFSGKSVRNASIESMVDRFVSWENYIHSSEFSSDKTIKNASESVLDKLHELVEVRLKKESQLHSIFNIISRVFHFIIGKGFNTQGECAYKKLAEIVQINDQHAFTTTEECEDDDIFASAENEYSVNRSYKNNAFLRAATLGHEYTLKLIIQDETPIPPFIVGEALYEACLRNHSGIAQFLLSSDLAIDADDVNRSIRAAVINGHQEIVKMLVFTDGEKNTALITEALDQAFIIAHKEMIAFLVSLDQQIAHDIFRPTICRAIDDDDKEVVELLLSLENEQNDLDYALFTAFTRGRETILNLILAKGLSLEESILRSLDSMAGVLRALYGAIKLGKPDLIRLLLSDGRKVPSYFFSRMVIKASRDDKAEIVEALLDQSRSIDQESLEESIRNAQSNQNDRLAQFLIAKRN